FSSAWSFCFQEELELRPAGSLKVQVYRSLEESVREVFGKMWAEGITGAVQAHDAVVSLEQSLRGETDEAETVRKYEDWKERNGIVRNQDRTFGYDELTAKDPMILTVIDDTRTSFDRKKQRADALARAKELGYTNDQGNPVITVKDSQEDVIITSHGIKHGNDRRIIQSPPQNA
ncbi:MAG: hypothetical protein II506_08445, partial [Lachnospiraceae bacterium]|nr:hypothetical protein [Lachnospiraceae bacterium]